MKSVWHDNVKIKSFEKLNKNIQTDVLIIGGGMAGLLCAYLLHNKGINYTLVEAKKIGMGVTKNTTAKITVGHGLIYDKLLKSSAEKAKQYITANQLALDKYKDICAGLDCDFEELPSYIYSLNDRNKIEREAAAISKIGFLAEFVEKTKLPFNIAGAVKYNGQAQFNPLKFISNVSQNLNIYENTFIRHISGKTAYSQNSQIKANYIIIATHFPFINSKGLYFAKMYQHRSYSIAFDNAINVNGMYVDEKNNGLSFRNYKNSLIIGGGDHRTGKTGGGYNEVRHHGAKLFPNSKEKYYWASQDCMTLDSIPYIGRYSYLTPNIFVATGFNKWGMTSSMASAMILSDEITGIKNEYGAVFNPQRSILKPKLLVNASEAVVNILRPSKKRCTHLGCALIWNRIEKTWDCPCHGSRFSKEGKLIDNPAMKNL